MRFVPLWVGTEHYEMLVISWVVPVSNLCGDTSYSDSRIFHGNSQCLSLAGALKVLDKDSVPVYQTTRRHIIQALIFTAIRASRLV
jgi:hypothetical protein